MIDKESDEMILKSEWIEKYGEPVKRGLMIINRKFESYISPTSGQVISSFKQREEDMKSSGCVDYEPSLKGEIDRNIEIADQQLEAKIEDSIDHAISALPARKQELLEQELNSDVNINVERR